MIEVPEVALTVVQPMATAIVKGWKPIENRKWRPWPRVVGKLIAIHAGAKWDLEYARFIEAIRGYATPIFGRRETQTAIIGVARVTGYLVADALGTVVRPNVDAFSAAAAVSATERAWFVGPFGWTLTEAREIKPIPCKGALALWRLPDDVRGVLAERLA